MSYDEVFFSQLREEQIIVRPDLPDTPNLENPIRNQAAETISDFSGFIVHLQKIITNVMPESKFMPEEEVAKNLFPDMPLNNSLIGFKVKQRKPLKELKPTMRHEVCEQVPETKEKRIGTVYAQRMEYVLQFSIFSSGYANSEKVMNIFEEAIFNYTEYLKKKGVIELIFLKQLEDETYKHFRERCSMRHLQYLLILDKQWIDFDSILETIVVS